MRKRCCKIYWLLVHSHSKNVYWIQIHISLCSQIPFNWLVRLINHYFMFLEHGLDSNAFIKMGQLLSLEGSDNSGLQSVSEVLSLWRRNNDSLEGFLKLKISFFFLQVWISPFFIVLKAFLSNMLLVFSLRIYLGPLEMIWWIGIWVLFSSIMLHLFAVVIRKNTN